MRVGIVSECPWVPSSFGKMVFYLAKGLIDEGFKTTVYCPTSPSPTIFSRKFLFKTKCDVERFCVDAEIETSQYLSFASGEEDLFIVFGTPYGSVEVSALNVCENLSKPCLGYFVTESLTLPSTIALWVTKVSFVATPTDFVRRVFIDGVKRFSRELGEEAEKRFMVAPHGINLDLYSRAVCEYLRDYTTHHGRSTELVEKIREARETGRTVVGFYAKNNPRKDVAALIKAVSSLGDEYLLLPILIEAVSSNAWADLATLVSFFMSPEESARRIIWVDPEAGKYGVTDYSIIRVLCNTDVFAYPTEGEAFGIPVVEALALEVPVVVTDIPVMREVLSGYPEEGFARCREDIYPPAYVLCNPDPEDVAEAIKRVSERREEIRRIARSIASRYDYRRMVREIIKAMTRAEEFFRETKTNKWGK